MEADFQGWATKPDLKCSDGRTISHGAFDKQDGHQVPLVWQHNHDNPENVLGHVKLEARDGGLYAHGYLNDSEKAKHARRLLEHKDITQLSIWANDLVERSKVVLHGKVREVSLVLSGANPGATIEHVFLKHDDGEEFELEDEAIIKPGNETDLVIAHAEGDTKTDEKADEDEEISLEEALEADGRTLNEILDSMDPIQQAATAYLVGEALAAREEVDDSASDKKDDAKDDSEKDDSAQHDSLAHGGEKGDKIMGEQTRNVFDRTDEDSAPKRVVLSAADTKQILEHAQKGGLLSDAMQGYALEHGIDNIELLFPDAQALNGGVPEWVKRDSGWVTPFLSACTKTPFGRIKTRSANITFEEARAKGYIKGELKKDEFFEIQDRTTTPATIYKKQKLDRDDIIDITDFDVVAWMRQEMRMMLDEEIARAILVGDGRAVDDKDKIKTVNIRPVVTDDDLYTTRVKVQMNDANSSFTEFVDAAHRNRRFYRGTGNPNFYTTELWIAQAMTLRDGLNRPMYKNLGELAAELRVNAIIPVEVLEDSPEIIGVMFNPVDYVLGAVKGGQVTMYDDFDIDYNQEKYLIETRLCGALAKIKAALVFEAVETGLTLVKPAAPTFDKETGELTIVNTTGVVYTNSADEVVNAAGSPYTVAAGESETIFATADTGYFFEENQTDQWTFKANPAS